MIPEKGHELSHNGLSEDNNDIWAALSQLPQEVLSMTETLLKDPLLFR
jgi:hypothetical protein